MMGGIAGPLETRDVAALSDAFELLENRLCAYFAVEESIAQALDFDFTRHNLAHQNLLYKFRRIKDEIFALTGVLSKGYVECRISFLEHELIQHIRIDDKPFKAILDTQLYDFRPA